MEGIEIIRYNPMLQKAFKYIIEESNSNYLPYHNLNHLLTVLKYTDKIAHGEEVYYDKRLPLHLAALFHDVNHSGGKLEDYENIENAEKAFEEFANIHLNINKKFTRDEFDIYSQVVHLIRATQFPYSKPNSATNRFEKIIRDADMMQNFENNWINQTTLGLASESNTSIKDFIPKQRHFLESITFLTKTANKIKEERWSDVMNQFRILEVSVGL
jgi:hypothetical protein